MEQLASGPRSRYPEQDHVRPERQGLGELLKVSTSISTRSASRRRCSRQGGNHPAAGDDVVVLDQDGVIQAVAVVGPPAATDGVLLQRPAGRGRCGCRRSAPARPRPAPAPGRRSRGRYPARHAEKRRAHPEFSFPAPYALRKKASQAGNHQQPAPSLRRRSARVAPSSGVLSPAPGGSVDLSASRGLLEGQRVEAWPRPPRAIRRGPARGERRG